MIEPWPSTKTLVIWTVSATIAVIVFVIAWVTRDERLLLEASGGFLATVVGEFFQDAIGRRVRRAKQNSLNLTNESRL